ncbi:MAG: type II secretion system protein GspL [Casimicrobiaceae bacterium]
MSVLRVLLTRPPSTASDDAWALFDAQERMIDSGRGNPASWPAADRREAVLAASAVRLAGIVLPPMPADRVNSAAAFALEDQLAGPANEQHLVASLRRRDGGVDVAIAARALFAPLAKAFSRVVAEPAVAPVPPANVWRWYASGAAGAFVRKADGSAFAVGVPPGDGSAPPELALALAQARRAGAGAGAPGIEVAFAADDAQLGAWSAQCATPFARSAAWRWDQDGAAIAAATDLLQGEFSREPALIAQSAARRFRWAVGLAAAAIALHVAATIGQWAWLRVDAWRTARAIVAVAADAGAGEQPDADAAAIALARRFSEARHRAALPAPADALPLLARAAPALAALPAGAFKIATYSPATWTFDLAKIDANALTDLDRRLTAAGLATLQATTNAGTRLRATLAPGTDLP